MGETFPKGFSAVYGGFAALLQAFFLADTAQPVVLSRSGVMLRRWYRVSAWAIWVIVILGALALVLNAITPSDGERAIWLPVALLLLACSLTIAIRAKRDQGE